MKKLLKLTLLILLSSNLLFATNPEITKNLVNLTKGISYAGNEDCVPEMVIVGETIHTSWTTYVSGSEAYLYYCRSTDLGETWDEPIIIWQFKDAARGKEVTSQRLAVSGNNVYIGFADYDYANNGTGQIFLSSSTNSGSSFNTAVEIVNSGGGYNSLDRSFIKASGDNVAIAFDGSGEKEGVRLLLSTNNGSSFTETTITEDNNNMSDFWYDGSQLIIAHEWYTYMYGLSRGRVYVSVSNDNGATFTTNKVSVTYTNEYGEQERCRCYHDQRYIPKIAKDGNNIHIIFLGNNVEAVWSVLYTRSTNGGNTFEEVRDFGTEILASGGKGAGFQGGQETITAKGENVYLTYLRGDGKCYFQYSSDNGATFSEPEDILTEETSFIQYTWWPQLVIDPTDESGKTLYFGGGEMMTRKSIDGGKSFHNTTYLFPLYDADVRESVLKIDNEGDIHWVSKARHYWSYDYDIFYTHKKPEPEPGSTNKSYSLKTSYNDIQETTIVPSSKSIEFDSVMTGEAWIRVKYDEADALNVFTKVNGYDSYNHHPCGYKLGINKGSWSKKLYLCAAIETDKGDYVIEADDDINPIIDSLWHHIAFTYDASAGLNNFKAYMDGLLIGEQTVSGEILQGDGLFIIGSSAVNGNSKYEIDDIRLWNRALTQKELLENQTKNFTGTEDGLKLFLNFDDTFKDISGNGNDAIPLYLGSLKESNFDPPITNFETYKISNEVSFNNKTTNATTYAWNFGNDETSELGNPKHAYSEAGEYDITLLGKNNNSVTSAIKHASIKGLSRVEPKSAGNVGETILTIYGGGLNANTKISLRSEDNTEIVADTVVGTGEYGFIQALFPFTDEKTGLYDLVADETVLADAFTLKQAEGTVQPWINISGRSMVLLNRWTKYKITYGNKGDADALMVPISFAVPDIEGLEVDFVDFNFVLPDIVVENNAEEDFLPYKDFFVTDVLWGKSERSKVYSLIIPRISANSSESLHILIKSPEHYKITSWVSEPWVKYITNEEGNKSASYVSENGSKLAVAECITEAIGVTLLETSVSIIPYAGALYNSAKTGYTAGDIYYEKDKVKAVRSTTLQAATTFFSYVSVVPVVGWVAGTVGGLVCGGISSYYAVSDCMSLGTNGKDVSTVSSLDPNEIIGPDGFSVNGWIPKINQFPYTILFENKSDATAPAHDVFITDTLDLEKFDISNFGFSTFGWGDSIFNPPGKYLKEFSMDIDLRPETNLITRVSGKLDTLNGAIKWEFLSLNPSTMDLEEDPLIGFLPPNITSPEGEGFVSFIVGIKDELTTNDEVKNTASIVFDANAAIVTNTYLNTFDEDAPQSQIYPLDENSGSRLTIAWNGSDVGSGISSYSIYVLENDTLLSPWKINTTELSGEFIGEVGSTYKFYSIAMDNVGLVEATPGEYDATTLITVGIEDLNLIQEELNVYPNPAEDFITISLANPPCGDYVIELISMNGTLKHSQIYNDYQIQNGIRIKANDYASGQYILKIMHNDKFFTRKVLIK